MSETHAHPVSVLASAAAVALSFGLALATPCPGQAGFEVVPALGGPTPRRDHALAFDAARGRVVLHGGIDAQRNVLRDTWEWDGQSWQELRLVAGPALARHAMVYDPQRRLVVAYGGSGSTTRAFSFDGRVWAPVSADPWDPAARRREIGVDHASLTFCDSLPGIVAAAGRTVTQSVQSRALFGWPGLTFGELSPWEVVYVPWADRVLGFGFASARGDVAAWRQDGPTWRWQDHAALSPTARFDDFAVVADTRRQRIVHVASDPDVRICEWNGVTWPPRENARHTILDAQTPGGDLSGGYAMVFDAARGEVLLFGGEREGGQLSGTLLRYWPVAPRVEPFGRGCAGSLGEPRLRQLDGLPVAGGPFTLQLSAVPFGGRPPVLYLGFSRVHWLGLPLPFDLGVAGIPGCQILASLDHATPMQQLGEYATWGMFLPNLPGVTFYAQAMVFDPRANSVGMVMSDATAITIGTRQ